MTEAKHTKTPWELSDIEWRRIQDSGTGEQIAQIYSTEKFLAEQQANAALIVHRVNTWDSLYNALKLCHKGFQAGRLPDQSIVPAYDKNATKVSLEALSDIVEQAISLAEATKP